jgi:DnaJ-class molecular chaperone
LGREEMAFIERVAGEIGLRPFVSAFGRDFGRGHARRDVPPRRSSIDDALAVLGLPANATSADIKSAWRKLSLENHPDRVTHLGGEFRALAEERMRGINEAYTRLKEAGRVE